jgi:RNA polymerase sigma-70 factor (ECF subfamily)
MFSREQLDQLYRYGITLARDRDAAYDLLQAALLSYLEQPAQSVAAPIDYLRRSMRNAAIDKMRSEERRYWESIDESDEVIDIDMRSFEQVMVDRSDIERVWRVLTIPEREVMFLWAVEGFTVDEIAQQIGVSRGTLLSRLHRLRKRVCMMSNGSGGKKVAGSGNQ